MYLQPDIKFQQLLLRWSKYLSGIVILIGMLVLVGWQFNISQLKHPFPDMAAMNPVTAVLIGVSALSLLFISSKTNSKNRKLSGRALAVFVLLISSIKLVSFFTSSFFRIDNILYY